MQRLNTPLPFLEALETLKNLKRSGWCQRSIPDPENVGNHMYQMQWWCHMHPKLSGDDKAKAAMMCAIHDVGEIYAGDITPADGIKPGRKHLLEELGVEYLSCLLQTDQPYWASELPRIWQEYAQNQTRIAQLVHQVDKLECLHQAFIYKKRFREHQHLEDFKAHRQSITDSWLAKQADTILADWETLELDRATSPIIFVIGGPGVGKGTVCARIAQTLNFEHISVGDVLREEQRTPSSTFGKFIAKSIQNSAIVPPSLTMLLLKNRIQLVQSQGKGILLDGFPRSVQQTVEFEQVISSTYSTIYLESTPDIMMERVRQRSLSSERSDDDTSVLRERIDTFMASDSLILQQLAKNRLQKINATGTADQVYSRFEETIALLMGDGGASECAG